IPLDPAHPRPTGAGPAPGAAGPGAPPGPRVGGDRSAIPPRSPMAGAVPVPADPTALPGNGARVVARPAEDAPAEQAEMEDGPDGR
ncbi:two-component sensor histidine kinase, partial [Streptomyces sp. NPDC059447]